MNRKPSDWLKYVKMHVHDGVPMTKLAAKYQFDVAKLKYKVKVYLLHGESPFTHESKCLVIQLPSKFTHFLLLENA